MVAGVKIAERKLKRMVNTSLRIEKLLKDSFPMSSGGKGRRKENKKDTRTTESEDCSYRFPGNSARKLVGTL